MFADHFAKTSRLLPRVSAMLAGGVLIAGVAGQARAGVIVDPTAIDAVSSEVGGRDADDTINGSGLSDATIVETGDAEPSPYPTHSTNDSDAWWSDVNVENNIDEVFITFDLGSVHSLEGMHIWNLNGGGAGRSTSSGVENLNVEFSTDGSIFSGAEAFTLNEAPGAATYTGESHDFASTVSARFVRFDVQTTFENNGSIVKDGDPETVEVSNRAGLSEVRFLAIPEPASAALLGLGGLMLLPRRRRG